MPFKSEKQRRYLWANHPTLAKRWAGESSKKSKPRKRRRVRVW